ncbi:MAG: Acyl-CoA synthase [Candidatus Giovannonibacteria bacterium GW2011_GWC2_44_9]|uniref:Acyl-CoA synthase n=1 Tax=Candidatus Giovannonibacteria bacterium GW2011_GWC2_44_9 TaxID=1618658 RepID=A0A0G1NH01_9BACT|nr:MAG: Acyl-CoA synthase [Candidatus Giovannonibacteria bacterium GW2011_GWC2_44_9]
MKNIEGLEAESRVDILLWSEWFYSFSQGLQRQILDAFNGINQVEEKAPADYVGELDKSIERGLFDFLPKVYDCPVLSEETPSPWPPAFRKFWIIDSLDGTHNFLAGLPIFGTIVALVAGGKAVFSAIYLPMDEQSLWRGLYVAAKGYGAFRRLPSGGLEPIQVSGQGDLEKAFLLLEGASKKLYTFHHIQNAVFATERVRNGLSFAYSLTRLAAGGCWTRGVDIIIAEGAKQWESFAGELFVTEAGGKATDRRGRPLSLQNYSDLVFSNGVLHDQILALNCPAFR